MFPATKIAQTANYADLLAVADLARRQHTYYTFHHSVYRPSAFILRYFTECSIVFTALHTRRAVFLTAKVSVRPSVCLSVCQIHA